MSAPRELYYALFHFWFRFDLLTRRREDRALKALGAITLVQIWLVLGGWWWCELLLGFPSPPRAAFVPAVLAIFAANYAVFRRGGWEEFELRFTRRPPHERRAWMLGAGAASAASLALLVGAAVFALSGG